MSSTSIDGFDWFGWCYKPFTRDTHLFFQKATYVYKPFSMDSFKGIPIPEPWAFPTYRTSLSYVCLPERLARGLSPLLTSRVRQMRWLAESSRSDWELIGYLHSPGTRSEAQKEFSDEKDKMNSAFDEKLKASRGFCNGLYSYAVTPEAV